MSKIYSCLVACTAMFWLTGCAKDSPAPAPKPTPTPTPVVPPTPSPEPKPTPKVAEVELQSNVMTYVAPKGKEDEYIIAYENGVLKLKLDKARALRAEGDARYGQSVNGKFVPSDPKVGDVIHLAPNAKIPDGLFGRIQEVSYGTGSVVSMRLGTTELKDVAKDINYEETINLVELITNEKGKAIVDLNYLLVDNIKGEKQTKAKRPDKSRLKTKVKLEGGKIKFIVNANLLPSKTKYIDKLGAQFSVSLEPNVGFRIRKKAKSDLPELFEVFAQGALDVDIDLELQKELKAKYSGETLRLATIRFPNIPIGNSGLIITPYLSVDLQVSLEGTIDATLKVFQYHHPFRYTAGYDERRAERWKIYSDPSLKASSEWFKSWAVDADLNASIDYKTTLNVTLNFWEGLRASLGEGLELSNQVKVSANQDKYELDLNSQLKQYMYAEFVFKPRIVEWLEYEYGKKFPIGEKTLFKGKFNPSVNAWDIRTQAKDAWEITPSTALLGGDIQMQTNPQVQIQEFGVCIAEHSNPKLTDRSIKYNGAQSTLHYTIKADGLSPETEYFYRSYVKFAKGATTKVAYSAVKSFTTTADDTALPAGVVVENGVLKKWPNTAIPTNGHVTVPSEVTAIGDNAFENCTLLKTITLPKKLKSIGEFAFNQCSLLERIDIPNSVTSIGHSAFQNCINLKSVNLPDKLQRIEYGTFLSCYKLEHIQTKAVQSIGNSAFRNCYALAKVEFTDALQSVGSSVFEDCKALTHVTLPNSVQSVSEGLFNRCINLKSVQLSVSMTSIPLVFFKDCRKLESVTLPPRIDKVYLNAFDGCTQLKTLRVKAINPPSAISASHYSTGSPINYKGKLIVPTGSKEAYEKHYGWKQCSPIVEED